jgi:hypothetical protein
MIIQLVVPVDRLDRRYRRLLTLLVDVVDERFISHLLLTVVSASIVDRCERCSIAEEAASLLNYYML